MLLCPVAPATCRLCATAVACSASAPIPSTSRVADISTSSSRRTGDPSSLATPRLPLRRGGDCTISAWPLRCCAPSPRLPLPVPMTSFSMPAAATASTSHARPQDRLRRAWHRHLDLRRRCRGERFPPGEPSPDTRREWIVAMPTASYRMRPLLLPDPIDHRADERRRVPTCPEDGGAFWLRFPRPRILPSCAATWENPAETAWHGLSKPSRPISRLPISAASPPRRSERRGRAGCSGLDLPPMRSKPVEAMRVTFSLDLLLFHPSRPNALRYG